MKSSEGAKGSRSFYEKILYLGLPFYFSSLFSATSKHYFVSFSALCKETVR